MYRSEVCTGVRLGVWLLIRAIDRIGRRFAELVAAGNSVMIATSRLVNRGRSTEMGGYRVGVCVLSANRWFSRLLLARIVTLNFACLILQTFVDLINYHIYAVYIFKLTYIFSIENTFSPVNCSCLCNEKNFNVIQIQCQLILQIFVISRFFF